jgi:hypothetical protein
MNPMVPLDLRDFFFYKRYGYLIGWSTLVDLGHGILNLCHDVLDLGYDILNKNKKIRGGRSRQIPRQNVEVTW